jgi:cyclopropane fatty-acyl-phospholipid synthase-like methyltransferase
VSFVNPQNEFDRTFMEQFRQQLYERYVSTLKCDLLTHDQTHLQYHARWCTHNYLPAIRHIDRNEPVLEVGCGPGYLLQYLTDQGFANVEGIDVSQEQIELARKRGLRAQRADVFEYLADKRETYAAIFAIDLVEHFTKTELLPLFAAVFSALKQGGVFVIQTPNGEGLFPGLVIYGDLTHFTIFTENSLRQLLLISGFTDIHFKETDPIPATLKGKIRNVLWQCVRLVVKAVRQIEIRSSPNLLTENMVCWAVKPQGA